MSKKLSTLLAALDAGGNGVYGDLKPGDRFRFPLKLIVYEKGFGGWFIAVTNGFVRYAHDKYRTGSGTAIVKVEGDSAAWTEGEKLLAAKRTLAAERGA